MKQSNIVYQTFEISLSCKIFYRLIKSLYVDRQNIAGFRAFWKHCATKFSDFSLWSNALWRGNRWFMNLVFPWNSVFSRFLGPSLGQSISILGCVSLCSWTSASVYPVISFHNISDFCLWSNDLWYGQTLKYCLPQKFQILNNVVCPGLEFDLVQLSLLLWLFSYNTVLIETQAARTGVRCPLSFCCSNTAPNCH